MHGDGPAVDATRALRAGLLTAASAVFHGPADPWHARGMDSRADHRLEDVREPLLEAGSHGPDARRAVLELALIMASADGETSEQEAERVVELLHRLAPGSMKIASLRTEIVASQARVAAQGTDARIEAAAAVLVEPALRRQAYRIVAQVALVDGWLDRAELRLFNQLARALEIPPQESTQIVTDVRRTLFPDDAP